MSSGDEQTPKFMAGHPPAVKAGGMRISQNKTARDKSPKSGNEDLTGLSGPSPLPSGNVLVGGTVSKGNVDFTPDAAQVAHQAKPPVQHASRPNINIQQPRK